MVFSKEILTPLTILERGGTLPLLAEGLILVESDLEEARCNRQEEFAGDPDRRT